VRRVIKNGELYIASHITGPTHNLLKLRIKNEATVPLTIRVLPPIGECTHGDPLTSADVEHWIKVGVDHANRDLGTNYQADYAEIVANDTPRAEIYHPLARMIVLAAHTGEFDVRP
jgi:hypothetical protein